MQKIELPFGTISYNAPIVSVKIKDNTQVSYLDVKELTRNAERISNNTPYLLLVEMGVNSGLTTEAKRSAAGSVEQPKRLATAKVCPPEQFETPEGFFKNIKTDPKILRRSFTDKQEALDWLNEIGKVLLVK